MASRGQDVAARLFLPVAFGSRLLRSLSALAVLCSRVAAAPASQIVVAFRRPDEWRSLPGQGRLRSWRWA
jgi:hypothetical protein